MEASIIFHFAGRGSGDKRLAVIDFAQLLDPRWRAPHEEPETKTTTSKVSFSNALLQSTYNFVQGGQHHRDHKRTLLSGLQELLAHLEQLLYIPLTWVSKRTCSSRCN